MLTSHSPFRLTTILAVLLLPVAGFSADVIGIIPDAPANQPPIGTVRELPRTTPARPGMPDPALFDGSNIEPEKRPDQAMLAEFEVPGEENRPDRIAQSGAGQSGGGGQAEPTQAGEPSEEGGGSPVEQNDPGAQPEGIEVANLEIPEGVDPASQDSIPAPQDKPQDISLGDATMQIQTVSSPPASATQQQAATSTQQYEKGAAQGRQTGDNRNRGSERGQAVPSGL